MHFPILVPVNIDVTTQDEEKVKQAAMRQAALSALLESFTPKSIKQNMDKVTMEIEQNYCQALHNPFAVAVNAAIDEAMAPYSYETEDRRYCTFIDETEDLKRRFETGTIECIQYGAKYYQKHKLPGFRVCEDGVVREVTPTGQTFLSDKAKKMRVVTIPLKDFYPSFRKYANEYREYNPEQKAWGYYTNPNSFYDWFSIGGRWQGALLVSEECEEYANGVSCCGGTSIPAAPDGYKWVSAARIKDIAFDVMAQHKINKVTEQYHAYERMWQIQSIDDEEHYLSIENDGIYCLRQKVFDPNISLETILSNHNYNATNILSSIVTGYLDCRVNPIVDEDGDSECGYYSEDFCDEWEDAVNAFLAEFSDETVLVILDCHT
jgi:hypothetical protein